MSQPLEIDVFWSFRSPWSYLATRRLRDWQESYDLKINFRVDPTEQHNLSAE